MLEYKADPYSEPPCFETVNNPDWARVPVGDKETAYDPVNWGWGRMPVVNDSAQNQHSTLRKKASLEEAAK